MSNRVTVHYGKLKQKVIIPSLKERALALMLEAPVEEQIATLTTIDQMLSDEADALAEHPKTEPGAIPQSWVRGQWGLQGRGHLPGARAYFAAIKNN
jgi:hypothetical protein